MERLRSDYGSEIHNQKVDKWLIKQGIIFSTLCTLLPGRKQYITENRENDNEHVGGNNPWRRDWWHNLVWNCFAYDLHQEYTTCLSAQGLYQSDWDAKPGFSRPTPPPHPRLQRIPLPPQRRTKLKVCKLGILRSQRKTSRIWRPYHS